MTSLSAWATALSQHVPPYLQGNSERLEAYLTDLLSSHQELSQPDVAAARQAFFALKRPQAADYQEQELTLSVADTSYSAWAGIRFRHLNPQEPFVSCSLSLKPLEILADSTLRQALLQSIYAHFAIFQPHGVTVKLFQAPTQQLQPYQVWNRYWLRELSQVDSGYSSPAIRLESVPDLASLDYPRFLAQYQFWALLQPELASWVQPASAEELADSMAEGLCFQALLDDQPIGLIAGLNQDYYGHRGVSVLEFLVYPAFQGKGYGKVMQHLFQARLAQRGDSDVIWGTIHAENEASQRTAQACGRQPLEWEVFLPFDQSLQSLQSLA